MEYDDFWVGYLLVSYQGDEQNDVDRDGFLGGNAPHSADLVRYNTDIYDQTFGAPPGGIGAVIFLEGMRDRSLTPFRANEDLFTFARTRMAPHEVGHQLGLAHNEGLAGTSGGIMSYTGTLYFTGNHVNLMRWRVKSPGEGL